MKLSHVDIDNQKIKQSGKSDEARHEHDHPCTPGLNGCLRVQQSTRTTALQTPPQINAVIVRKYEVHSCAIQSTVHVFIS